MNTKKGFVHRNTYPSLTFHPSFDLIRDPQCRKPTPKPIDPLCSGRRTTSRSSRARFSRWSESWCSIST